MARVALLIEEDVMPPKWMDEGSTVGATDASHVAVVSPAPGNLEAVINENAGTNHAFAKEFAGAFRQADWTDLGDANQQFNVVLNGVYGPAAIVTPDGGIDAVIVCVDGTLLRTRWNPDTQKWTGLHKRQKTPSPPSELISMCYWFHPAVFVRCGSEPYYMPSIDTNVWRPLGGAIKHGPVAVATPGTRMDLFAIATDGHLLHKSCVQGLLWQPDWNEWNDLGGNFIQRPAVVRLSDTDLHVFVKGYDETGKTATHHFRLSGDQWSIEPLLPGEFNDICAVSGAPDRLDLFARTGDKFVYHRRWQAGQWNPGDAWENLEGDFYSARPPAAIAQGPDHLDVFIVALDDTDLTGKVWHRWWDGTQWIPSA